MKSLQKLIIMPVFCFSIFLFGCQHQQYSKETLTDFYLNTVVSVTVYESQSDSYSAKELCENCMNMTADYENLFSKTIEGSDIWNINHSGGVPVTVSDETITLLQTAISYSELSNGLVDPTIGTLSTLWNFSENKKTVPSDEEIQRALSHVDYHAIHIEGSQVYSSDPDACIDLGFIAKGYIADRLKEYLCSQGVSSAIINLGGNVQTIGNKPDNTAYKVGVQKPFAETGTALLSVSVTNKSVVSSGNYERCFWIDDTLYHHILSTENGYPVTNDLSQVTIICDSSADGDALSTLCFILGYDKGRELIENLPDTEAIFVMQDGSINKTY